MSSFIRVHDMGLIQNPFHEVKPSRQMQKRPFRPQVPVSKHWAAIYDVWCDSVLRWKDTIKCLFFVVLIRINHFPITAARNINLNQTISRQMKNHHIIAFMSSCSISSALHRYQRYFVKIYPDKVSRIICNSLIVVDFIA